jgi:hypothetical protein
MPFASKFRAMMDFPFAGDAIEGFTVESVDVLDAPHVAGCYVYAVRMVLRGPGGQQGVRRALKSLFASRPVTFSAYGNAYHLWFNRPDVESLGDKRYEVRVEGGGARFYLGEELRRFLCHLAESGRLSDPADQAALNAQVEAYLAQYQDEIRRKVNRYRSRLRRATRLGS